MNLKLAFMILMVFSLASSGSHAAEKKRKNTAVVDPLFNTPFDFKGVVLGSPLSEFKNNKSIQRKTVPDFSTISLECSEDAGEDKINKAYCIYYNKQTPYHTSVGLPKLFKKTDSIYIGNCIVNRNSFSFASIEEDSEPLLYSISLEFSHSCFENVLEALVDKFGKPSKTTERTSQNAFGAKFSNNEFIWLRNMQSIDLEERYEDIDTSVLYYFEHRIFKFISDRKPKKSTPDL